MTGQSLYNLATLCASPALAGYLAARPSLRPLLERFRPAVPAFADRPLWVHACSVGEVNTAARFLAPLAERLPGLGLLLTTSTISGHGLAKAGTGEAAALAWAPFDVAPSVARFLDLARPRAIALMETEIWPNTVRLATERGAPVAVVNARLSDRHFPRYLRHRWFWRHVFGRLACVGAQNETYADRFRQLGAPPEAVHVTGCAKFDGVQTEVEAEVLEALRRENGFGDSPVVVFGSTRPGDEALAARCWETLRERDPALKLVVAPRHVKRADAAAASFREPVLARSEVKAGRRPAGERVFLLDTVGELVQFYALGCVAVVGGSFFPGVEGHNPVEPAALGVPTVFGPFMRNFVDSARQLVERGGACQVQLAADLPGALTRLLESEEERKRLAERGRAAVLEGQGAVMRNIDMLLHRIPGLGG